ncbi:MAG: hypothetical protein A3I44_05230 [Candidatus Sungbacteria bacterium RIFCSPLOWO2_02_FULL_51_17]|uniref:DUF4419 domain-containing protein n=1 Tax=Candidatus Sungbacteria bacterium RIFCSPHIGHO2_02_FULL_51_29 TaxID=1802273 RepID=A0A1G2KP37_9BACT|nr:MAG: hypothetical protein A2676_00665 [Candidatus Sungbacteria bacterium RIFCSPHIGHO2_01_FULL_51_22]OHA01170.1 MAG: hypothetical protein A3C16_04600 [Candidatus Sungbacteria bacterium RIFCSPHIGHO2_02_FULL_51_29]OHA08046.1 MAG: hypothetical protein A3B29_03810 [Candidatus Sungbacteria bacterium RIFCSPLOWO2_01_FULL_51_34]OHA11474.1 MAG: hypothetical protein A3I44_05230 [Candidatus Sungbacteria bacterium RIFCSPLOWO2_02_FULL_51_17]
MKGDAGAYANMFTTTPGEKQKIVVRDDSLVYGEANNWERSIGFVKAPLRERISPTVLLEFLPQFSTMNVESEAATLVSFMDVVSKYYDFEWQTMCGIPAVRLEGTAKDWELLRDGARLLARRFPPLAGYFNDLVPVLDALAAAAAGVPVRNSFWKSLYKFNEGSGGPYVGGWITAFFAYLKDGGLGVPQMRSEFNWERERVFGGLTTDMFPPHVSKVDFVWDYYGTELLMSFAGGILGIDLDDGFLRPRLGIAVVERGRE